MPMSPSSPSGPQPRPSIWQIVRRWVFDPPASVSEIGARRQAQLLAGMSLVLAASLFASVLAAAGTSSATANRVALTLLPFAMVAAYLLSRTQYFRIGSYLLVLVIAAAPFGIMAAGNTSAQTVLLSFLPLAFVIGAALLTPWELGIAVGATSLAAFLVPQFIRGVEASGVIGAAGVSLTVGALLVIVVALQRSVERARLGDLSETNQELQGLRETLENRVEERTRELATAQRRTEALLLELDEASRIANLASFEIELATQTLVFSDRFYELLGTTTEAEGGYRRPITEAVQKFAHPEDGARLVAEVQALFAASDAAMRQLEYRLIHVDGAAHTFAFRFQVERDMFGNAERAKGAVQDITERKQIEQALLEHKEELASLLESSPEAVGVVNTQTGLFENVNAAAERLYGLARDELVKLGMVDVSPEYQPDGRESRAKALEKLREAMQGGAPAFEWLHRNAAGETLLCEMRLAGLTGLRQHLVRFSVTDITARKLDQEALSRRAAALETVTRLATSIATIQNPQAMLQHVVELVKLSFNLYHAHIYLLNQVGDTLILTAGAGEVGRQMVEQKRTIPLDREQSLVARAARTRQAVIVNDVTREPDFLPHPLLPFTKSELAVPLIVGVGALGVLDIQSNEADHFTAEDAYIQTILAAQIAVALQNARSLAASETARRELDALNRRLTREGWQEYLSQGETQRIGYMFDDNAVVRLSQDEGRAAGADGSAISRPIMVGGQAIGKLVAAEAPDAGADLADVLDAVAQGLSTHVENLRLSERTQQALAQTEALYNATATLTSAASLSEILHAVANTRGATSTTLLTILPDAHGQPKELVPSASWSATQDNALPLGTRLPIDQFPTSQVWLNDPDNAVIIGDLNTDPRIDPFTRDYSLQFGVQAYVYMPLRVGGNWVGLLVVSWAQPQKFTEADAQLFRAIAAQTAVVINNRLLFEQTQKRAEREALINTITQKIQSSVTVESALQTALRELGTALKAQRASVALKLADGNGGSPDAVAAEG